MRRYLARIRQDQRGAAAIEFALIAPLLIGMMLGVLQIGIAMQNYNALRSISADVARYAVVNYQTNTRLTTSQLQDYAYSVGTTTPYGLQRSNLVSSVGLATTQRVSGATEYTITLNYDVPSILTVIGVGEIPLSYSRPVFVVTAS